MSEILQVVNVLIATPLAVFGIGLAGMLLWSVAVIRAM